MKVLNLLYLSSLYRRAPNLLDKKSAMSATKLLFLEDTYRFTADGYITEFNNTPKGNYLVLDQIIFYPKGGGQPFDTGKMLFEDGSNIEVNAVQFDGATGKVLHYICLDTADDSLIGKKVDLAIDMDRRLTNARAHTAGHLVDAMVQEVASELVGKIGSHDVKDGCYVKFQGLLSSIASDLLISTVNEKLDLLLHDHPRSVEKRLADPFELTDLKLPDGYTLPEGKPCRIIQIEGLAPSPCGGTHVNSLAEFKQIKVSKVSLIKKENMTKINYTFE